jgi:hypothetical protein
MDRDGGLFPRFCGNLVCELPRLIIEHVADNHLCSFAHEQAGFGGTLPARSS